MAAYPDDIYNPLPAVLQNNIDVVLAEHVNDLRDELRGIERAVGLNPNVTTTIITNAQPGVDYSTSSGTQWSTLAERLANVERAALRDLDGNYVKLSGASIITSTSSGGGLGIRPPVNNAFAALEVLATGKSWDAGDLGRSTIRLWSSGLVEASRLQLSGNGSAVTIDPSSSRVIDAGNVYITSGGRLASTTRMLIDGGQAAATRLLMTVSPGDNPSGVAALGSDQFGDNRSYAGVTAVRVDTTGDPAAPSIQLTKDGATTLRVTASGNFDIGDGSILLNASQQRVEVGSATMSSSGFSVGASVLINSTQVQVSGVSLSSAGLTMGTASLAQHPSVSSILELKGSTDGSVVIGPRGEIDHPLWAGNKPAVEYDYYSGFVKITGDGYFGTTTVSGNLELPNNQTAYWPRLDNDKAIIWIKTRPRVASASDLEPGYWDPMYHWIDGPEVPAFTIVAPATGDVKITVQGELWGNVSRSAMSYEIRDIAGNVVLPAGGGHAISFNAPIADTPADHFYVNLSNTFFVSLNPGSIYYIQLKAQRAVPGNDSAGPYFPWHPNYDYTYPWGKWFAVKYPRVIVEPSFSAVYTRG